MKKLLLLPLVTFFLINTYAQTGEIKGIVKGKGKEEPLWNASVYVEYAGSLKGDGSDFDGKFTIKPLTPGMYTVVAKIQGYKTIVKKDVQVTSDNITYVDFEMIATAEVLPEIVIETFEIDIIDKAEPGVQKVLPEELKYSPNARNPIKIAASLPGVTLAPNGKDVYIRGSRPQSTQFITDGMKSITGGIGINGQAIGSMKVYTGGVPAQYGDLTGGVIVVETKSYFDLAQRYK